MIARLTPLSRSRAVLALMVAATLVLLIVLALLDRPLRVDSAPRGTISMEFAGDVATAEAIVTEWRGEGVIERASFLLGLDYLFAPLYAMTLALTTLAAGRAWQRRGRDRLAVAAPGIAAAALLAMAFDWVENSAMATSYLGQPAAPWPTVASVAAVPKFAAVLVAIIYALMAMAASCWAARDGAGAA